MPSPFPGMDPFLEGAEWEDFHTRFNTAISEYLATRVEPRYLVRIERRVYVEHTTDDRPPVRRADVAVFMAEETALAWAGPVSTVVRRTRDRSNASCRCPRNSGKRIW